MAMAARMPMIATTIISSMRVKPRWLRRLVQKLSIGSSIKVRERVRLQCSIVLQTHCREPPPRGGAVLREGRDCERGCAGLGEADSRQRVCAGLERDDGGSVSFADRGHDGFRRIIDEDQPFDDLVA